VTDYVSNLLFCPTETAVNNLKKEGFNNILNSINPINSKRLKILMLLTNAFDPDPRVHQEAMALVSAGYDVTIICWDRDLKAPAYEMIDGIKVERIYVKSTHGRGTSQLLFLLLFWLRAYVRLIKKQFQIVHCHDFDTLPLGFLISKCKHAKLVYDAHESYVDMLVNLPGWLKMLIYGAENILLRRTNLLITVGEILRNYLAQRGAPRTCVVGNWKDPSKFQFSENLITSEKERLQISDSQIVISFIANLDHERQLPQLIEAIKDTPSLFLLLGGVGPCKGIVEDAARSYSNVCYLGYVHPSKVPFYTALSDVIFYGFDPNNSNARFSAPNKLFEAIAAGKAVMTGDFGEIGEIVKETECGIIIDNYSIESIKNAISQLNVDILKKYMDNSHKATMRKYCWDMAKQTLLNHYKELSR
jgi:glycosyltransferase involved in cell wall biosynthesis